MVKIKVEDQLNQIKMLFKALVTSGMFQHNSLEWPVRIIRCSNDDYIYTYPESYFKNLIWSTRVYVNPRTRKDRVTILRWLLDSSAKKEIDVFLLHFGLYLIYGEGFNKLLVEDVVQVGIRRGELFFSLPRFTLLSNDDFLSYMWEKLIAHFPSNVTSDYRCNPELSELRMLFKPERFSQFAHVPVSEAEWIEPISGARDLGYRKWVAEKDPMISKANKPDMIEGPIILGHPDRGSRRHFVCGELVCSGCYIEIKFGGGWIPGRYEYLSTESQIRIISTGGDVIFIEEHHMVRINQ
ncbi:hypothetical protein [Paenibacillus sp. USHLN196]|uniref:hypothetical protein n=1 Tax=Paenibacillus sp. USHLN196 TaxID=3081291 RepID=UPI003017E0A9